MPRKRSDVSQAEIAKREIKKAMADQGIETYTEMAEKIGMAKTTFSWKMRTGNWNLREFRVLVQTLHIRSESLAKIMGI